MDTDEELILKIQLMQNAEANIKVMKGAFFIL
jgi:hypothetical protein